MCAVAIFGVCYWFSGLSALIEAHGRTVVFHDPLQGAIGVALLTHQLGYFNILPLYVVLMALSPLILAVARIEPLLALFSGGAYLAARLLDFHLPNWPEPGGWFFNPFAWQFIFTLGIVAAIRWRDAPLRPSPAISGDMFGFDGRRSDRRDRRIGPSPRPARLGFRPARRRQAKSRRGSARQLSCAGLCGRHVSHPDESRADRSRRGVAEPRATQPDDIRRQLGVERARPSRHRRVERRRRRSEMARVGLHPRLHWRIVRAGEIFGMAKIAEGRQAAGRRPELEGRCARLFARSPRSARRRP